MSDRSLVPDGFRALSETNYMTVLEDPERRVILAVRKQGAPMPAEDVLMAHRELTEIGEDTAGWGLLLDTRQVTGNADPRFETAIARANELVLAHFGRVVVLVRSAIGRLHADRLTGTGPQTLATSDIDEALAFLLG